MLALYMLVYFTIRECVLTKKIAIFVAKNLLLEEITLHVLHTLQFYFDSILPAISDIIILRLTSVVAELFQSQPMQH